LIYAVDLVNPQSGCDLYQKSHWKYNKFC